MQIVAVLLIAVGLGAASGAIGGLAWGIGIGGLFLAALAGVFLLDLGDDL